MQTRRFFFFLSFFIFTSSLKAQQHINITYASLPATYCSGLSMFSNIFGMAGADGVLYRTFDAGQSWNPVSNLQNNNLHFEYVPNSNGSIVLAVDYMGNLYKSTDYGNTWNNSIIDTNISIRRIKCINQNVCFAFGYLSFYRSADAGATWTQIPGFYPEILDIEFEDSLTGYAGGFANPNGGGKLYKTVDGGITWTNIFTTNLYGLSCLSIPDHDTIFAGTSGGILKINNTGTYWTYSYTSPYQYTAIWDIEFENNLHGYACGRFGIPVNESLLLETNDGGNTWQSYTDTTATSFTEVEITSLGLYIVADSGRISNPTQPSLIPNFCPIDNISFRHFMNSNGSLTVTLPHQDSEIKVYDFYGTLVGQDNCSGGECDLNVNIGISGIYLIEIKAGNEICVYRQVIIAPN